MDNMKARLKSAFIDAQLVDYTVKPHTFSDKFEAEMQNIIRYQKGLLKLINTTAKKIACVILCILIIAAGTVFSVEALREEVIEVIQSFFVEVKEKLSGTRADNISDYFSDNITRIKATNLITTTPKEYIIDNKEKISAFTALLASTDWNDPQSEFDFDTRYANYKFEFIADGEVVTTLNICSQYTGLFGTAQIIHNGKSAVYNISEKTYLEILAFTTQKYYLHNSDLDKPDAEHCLDWQEKILKDFDDTQKEKFCETFKYLHIHLENFLLGNISLLKEPDSIYWKRHELERDEVFKDPISGSEGIDNSYHIMLDGFETLISMAKDTQTREMLIVMKADYINAFKHHDIGSLFSVHEVIHDFDYFAVNYPISFSLAPPDWGGIDDYFGHLK